MKRTSWWTGVATENHDYGTCQKYRGELAPVYVAPRWTPCPPAVARAASAFPRLGDTDRLADVLATTRDGRLLVYRGSGQGGFLGSAQLGSGWSARNLVTHVGDLSGDGLRDLLARGIDGSLYLYRGAAGGGFQPATTIGRGWSGMDAVLGVGDLDASGTVDLVVRRRSDSALLFFPGDGKGAFGATRTIGSMPGHDLLTALGDWDGDSRPT